MNKGMPQERADNVVLKKLLELWQMSKIMRCIRVCYNFRYFSLSLYLLFEVILLE